MQINEHAGQAQPAPRLPGMDPETATARVPLEARAERPATRPSDSDSEARAARPATRTTRKPIRYGAGF